MKKYLLASDLDGTLIKHNDGANAPRTILGKDKVILKQFSEDGNIFILSTGRDKISTFALFEREKIFLDNSYFITSNGAEIYNSDKECIYKKILPENIAEAVLKIFIETNNSDLECRMFDGEVERKIESFGEYNLITEPIINICIFSKSSNINEAQNFYKLIENKIKQVTITMNNWYVDIIPEGVSKASSINHVLKLQEDSIDIKVIAIGDSWNDISMFKIADASYTFHSSPENVKSEADYVVEHLYEALESAFNNKY